MPHRVRLWAMCGAGDRPGRVLVGCRAFAQLIDRAVRTALEAKVHARLLPR